MRLRHLFLTTALGALVVMGATAGNAQACCCCGWGWGGGGGWGGYGYGYGWGGNSWNNYGWGGGYYRAAQMYYARPVQVAPRPLPMMPGAPPRPTATVTVTAKDDSFDSGTVNIQPGTTVHFVNGGKHVHTVTSNDGKFESGDIPPGGSFNVVFMTPGTYKYHCKHHKGMDGTIVVAQPAKATK